MNNTGIIILAAGSSSRFGKPKQLLHFNSKTLIEHAIDEAVKTGAEPVVVVTGDHADAVAATITDEKVTVVYNDAWKQGMASGIVAGLKKAITLNNDIEKVIIAVCDQPFVTAELFTNLYNQQNQTTQHIVASAYADTLGTPALFTQKYFDALMSLKGDEGAKKILKANKEDVAIVEFLQGDIDIDTQKDYDNLLDAQKHIL